MTSAYSNRFVPLLNVYFHCYLVIGLTFQSFLLLLIVRRSPSNLKDLKLFLYNTCGCQIVNILAAYFIQYRVLPNSSSLAILANGLCRVFGPDTCFATYHVFVGVGSSVALSISATVVFRYSLIKNWQLSRNALFGLIFSCYVGPFFVTTIPFTSPWNYTVVREQTAKEHPNHDLSIYEPFPGFSDTTTFRFLFVTFLVAIGAYCIPLISMFIIRKIMILTKTHTKLSPNTKHHTRTMMKGLACQVILPLLSYFPIITLYLITQFTAEEFLVTEHLMVVMTCLPALIDPFLSFYFVIPYRMAILRLFLRKKVSTIDVTNQPPVSLRLSTLH